VTDKRGFISRCKVNPPLSPLPQTIISKSSRRSRKQQGWTRKEEGKLGSFFFFFFFFFSSIPFIRGRNLGHAEMVTDMDTVLIDCCHEYKRQLSVDIA
jgi:hypothetical protein